MSTWERAIAVAPDRAYLTLDRLERAYGTLGYDGRFLNLCQRLTQASPREWRARVALAQHIAKKGKLSKSLELLFDALEQLKKLEHAR